LVDGEIFTEIPAAPGAVSGDAYAPNLQAASSPAPCG
jgi:hypothetical protein